MKINTTKDVAKRKLFLPEEKTNFIPLAMLESVTVVETEMPIADDKGVPSTYEYAGFMLPSLQFTFKQAFAEEDAPERYLQHVEKPMALKNKDGELIDDKTIESVIQGSFDRIRHIYEDGFKKSPNYKAVDWSKLPELKEKADVQERLESYKAFYEFIADAFNKGKVIGVAGSANSTQLPVFMATPTKHVYVWLKVIAHMPDMAYLCLPTYIGRGFVEPFSEKYPKPTIYFEGKETYVLSKGKTKSANADGGAAANLDSDESEMSPDLQKLING